VKKFVESLRKAGAFLRPFGRFLWKLSLVIAACGIYDVTRNKKLNRDVLRRYFLGNGQLTWLLSPFNTFLDLLALPHVNKGIYKLEDPPAPYQEEIQSLIDTAYREDLVGKIESLAKERARTMIFFKWYGTNVDAPISIPAYHEKYQYIRTIGVSVFNKKQSTSRHFGPFRATLRVLYNINDMQDHSAYIEVGNVKHYWQEEKLFIFDDTLLHQSFNESDNVRYCLFVDILRPAASPVPFDAVVRAGRFLLQSVNYIFYKNWDVIKK
jgi:aspartyl/asparaginyl beta-hydroxylase (cupin superfamily)